MRVIAAITEPTIASHILKCMGLPPRAPPLELAHTSGLASDPWLEEAEAAGFDQSRRPMTGTLAPDHSDEPAPKSSSQCLARPRRERCVRDQAHGHTRTERGRRGLEVVPHRVKSHMNLEQLAVHYLAV